LALTAKQEPEQALSWWETGPVCECRYRVGEQWYNLRPDALAAYRAGSQQFRFWLEWDRGTVNVRDLGVKFSSYAQFVASREWAREFPQLPRLLCVAPELAQERRIQRVEQVSFASSAGLAIRMTTAVLLRERGPLAPIWSPGPPLPCLAAQSEDASRQRLFETIFREKGR
jgi:Replication-relaxation